jgi:hypothetical protein
LGEGEKRRRGEEERRRRGIAVKLREGGTGSFPSFSSVRPIDIVYKGS